jgi:hypothetical protein
MVNAQVEMAVKCHTFPQLIGAETLSHYAQMHFLKIKVMQWTCQFTSSCLTLQLIHHGEGMTMKMCLLLKSILNALAFAEDFKFNLQ